MFASDRRESPRTIWYKPSKYKTWWGWLLAWPFSTRPANWRGWLAQFLVYIVPLTATIIVLSITDVSIFWGMVTFVPLAAIGVWIDWLHMPKPERPAYHPASALRQDEV